MKRDCQCPRVRHQHGTANAYNTDGCRCRPCTDAVVDRQREYRKRRHLARSANTNLTLPPDGTQRRLRALAVLGWTSADLGARLGVTPENVQNMQRRTKKLVYLGTARKVAALYDELAMRRPEPFGWQHARRARTARAQGWEPPLSWDDDEIDDPAATPHTPGNGAWDRRQCGTPAAYKRHLRHGEPIDEACRNANRRATAERKGAA